MDAGPAYQKNLSEEVTKLQRLYGGGDFNKFPDFKFLGWFGLTFVYIVYCFVPCFNSCKLFSVKKTNYIVGINQTRSFIL